MILRRLQFLWKLSKMADEPKKEKNLIQTIKDKFIEKKMAKIISLENPLEEFEQKENV